MIGRSTIPDMPADAGSESGFRSDTDADVGADTDTDLVTDETGFGAVTRIERGFMGRPVNRSERRDSQVRSTAQRSGRCLVGVRRFKSCSLHPLLPDCRTDSQPAEFRGHQ